MTTTELCAGRRCRDDEQRREPTDAGSRLCKTCHHELVTDLRRLPALYAATETILGGGGPSEPGQRRTNDVSTGMPFNLAACETRTQIVDIVSSWSALVVDERRVRPPRRTVAAMSAFLLTHSDWLGRHPAADDISREISTLVRRARRLLDTEHTSRRPVGACVEPDCTGSLWAVLRSGATNTVRCDRNPAHRWDDAAWLTLQRRMHGTPAGAPEPASTWLSATDIAKLLRLSTGSVYRLASEHAWQRRNQGGRVQYRGDDVATTMRRRQAAADAGRQPA
ncbi:hypothetical protein BJF85_11175 [Saccharomonospora sp. CUA-673]|uniref:helix-turn-helix domain-containing protein n=1 Tax=Saccharomonospora sp. CUA-673 TaxID=1904969 RepID=UPI00095EB54E|nr:helix-turn-helix domain-containing protein [Saccharomonospora sp. CUA-673]OLT48994.1 hypothetical protein BJF85_11175 [Saccharomonospora sp. CUA-673]